jgi:hypothetical protein
VGLYLLYLGLPRVMKCPQEKAMGYTAVVVLSAIVLTVVTGAIGGGSASSVTDASPDTSLARMARRVGSASVAKVASRRPCAVCE